MKLNIVGVRRKIVLRRKFTDFWPRPAPNLAHLPILHTKSAVWRFVVRAGRIGLPSHPWQGRVLPLNHARKINF